MEVEKAEKGAASGNKLWLLILATLSVVIVILTVVIIIVAVNRNSVINDDVDDGRSRGEKIAEAERIYSGYSITISTDLAKVATGNKEAVLAVYRKYLDETDNRYARAMMAIDYYQMVMAYDTEKQQKDEVINKLLEVDAILRTSTSAVMVMNAANYYDDTVTYEHYKELLREREIEEGIDPDMETNG